MQYRKLGTSGLDISPVCVGCMTFGEPSQGYPGWSLPESQSMPLLQAAFERGINFFDTANGYSDGASEEILGRAIKRFSDRDTTVISTKVNYPMRPGPNIGGLSRKAILAALDASLRRLDVDYIDLYQIHRFDKTVPLEETLKVLDDVVRSGKVRYIGASSMYAWQFGKALHLQQQNGWTRFISMQDHYNLLNREEEREMLPLCQDEGVGTIPWSPVAKGLLTRDWESTTPRSAVDLRTRDFYANDESDRAIVDAVADVAAKRGVSRAQVALAWVSHNPVVSAPIIGVSRLGHIDDAVASLDIDLTDDEVAQLQAPYIPRAVAGF
jgi:aryl-alcohol dehydrogenase-like predicted oxidoreductase